MAPADKAGAAFGLGMAALITTFFGFVWFGWGLSAEKAMTVTGWILLYFAALALLFASVRAVRRGKALMTAKRAGRDEFWAKRGKRFRLITVLEGVGCGIVVLFANVFHRMDLLAAGISFVVGLHFLPLAGLFQFPAYYATGIAIVLSDVLICAFFRNDAVTVWVGIATGTVLWVTSIYALRRSRKFQRDVSSSDAEGVR